MAEHLLQQPPDGRCQFVTDWTCDENGDPDHEIYCGQLAEWRSRVTGIYSCSDCYAEHTESDRAEFEYVFQHDEAALAAPCMCSATEEKSR